jgi:hypothetical protein
MPVDDIAGAVVESVIEIGYQFTVELLYEGVFKRLFHATGRLIIRTFTFNRVQILPNKRQKVIGHPLRPKKGDGFAVFLGFVFWATFGGLFIYWNWFA